MTTIVLNTAVAAVSEYSWSFKSLTATHAADDNGLYTLGGDTDAGALVVGEVRARKTGGARLLAVSNIYYSLNGTTGGTAIVDGENGNTWTYSIIAHATGVSTCDPGKGIRQSFLGFGYRNDTGANFRIDRIDADVVESISRRR